MRIYLAVWLFDVTLGRSLTSKGANRRLLSYHFIREQGVLNSQFRRYVRTGRLDTRVNKTERVYPGKVGDEDQVPE